MNMTRLKLETLPAKADDDDDDDNGGGGGGGGGDLMFGLLAIILLLINYILELLGAPPLGGTPPVA